MKTLLAKYREYLKTLGARPESIYQSQPDGYALGGPRAIDNHLLHMLDEMDRMAGLAPHGLADPAKLNRWLGFVQGVLWLTGMYSLDQLRDQTREATAGRAVPEGRILD